MKNQGNILISVLAFSAITLTVGIFALQSLVRNQLILNNEKGVSENEGVLDSIVARTKFDLADIYCKNGQKLKPITEPTSVLEFSKNNPKIYGKGAFVVSIDDKTMNAPEDDPKVSISSADPDPDITGNFQINVATSLCKVPVTGRTPSPVPSNAFLNYVDSGKTVPWQPPCPSPGPKPANFIAFANRSEFGQCVVASPSSSSSPSPVIPPVEPCNLHVEFFGGDTFSFAAYCTFGSNCTNKLVRACGGSAQGQTCYAIYAGSILQVSATPTGPGCIAYCSQFCTSSIPSPSSSVPPSCTGKYVVSVIQQIQASFIYVDCTINGIPKPRKGVAGPIPYAGVSSILDVSTSRNGLNISGADCLHVCQ